MQYKSNVKKNYLYSALYQILLIAFPLLTTPYIARVFGAEGTGVYTMVNTVGVYFLRFSLMGIGTYGNRSIAYIRDNSDALNTEFTEIYATQLLFSGISLVCYFVYANTIAISDRLLVNIYFLYVLSGAFDVSWFYYGIEKIHIISKINITTKIINIICIFAFVKNIDDLWKYTLIMCLGFLTNTFLAWLFVFRYVKFVSIELSNIRARIKPCLIFFIPVIASSVYKSMDKLMLGILTNSNSLVGLYNNSEQIIGVPQGLITAAGLVLLPRISNQISLGKKEKSIKEIRVGMRFINFLAFAVTFGIVGVANEFIPIFLGKGFEKCILFVILLSPCNLLISWGYSIRNQYLIPWHKDNVYVVSIVAGAVINFGTNLILIPIIGIYGAIVGTIFAELVVAAWQTIAARVDLDIGQYIKDLIPFIIASIIMLLVIRMIGSNRGSSIGTVVIEIIVGGLVYVTTCLLYFGIFEIDNLKSYLKLMKRK